MKQFDKTILHVGPDKTGSTAIQATCDSNRALLLQHEIYYPSNQWHAELGSCFCDFPERYIFNSLSGYKDCDWIKTRDIEYLEKFRLELGSVSGNVLVLSYEGFVDLDIAALTRLKEFIGEYSDNCEVVFYARSPFSYAVSAMSQRVKSGFCSWTENDPPISPTRDFLEKLCLVFGKERLNVRKFSRDALPQGNVVLDFMSLLELPKEVCVHLSSQKNQENRALSAEALIMGDKIVESLKGRFSSDEFYSFFGNILERIKGGKVTLSPQQASVVENAAKAHLDYLVENFDITFGPEPEERTRKNDFITQDAFTSMADVLIELVLPEIKPLREVNSTSLLMHSAGLRQGHTVVHGQLLVFDVDFFLDREIAELEAGIHIFDAQGRWAFGTNSTLQKKTFTNVPRGSHRVSHYVIADLPAGRYTAGFAFTEKGTDGVHELAWRDVMCEFVVVHSTKMEFAGYAYLPAEISLLPTALADDKLLVAKPSGGIFLIAMPEAMRSNGQYKVMVAVQNTGNQLWLGDTFRPVNLSYHWFDQTGNPVQFDGLRTGLPDGGVPPGSTIEMEMDLHVPASPGKYRLELTLVQENAGWFEEKGFETFIADMEVV